MSFYIQRTMIIPAAHAPLARGLAAFLAGPPGAGMWQTGLSPTGAAPATHYVSSGAIENGFDALLHDGAALYAAVLHARGMGANVEGVTLADCEALVRDAEVVDLAEEGPFDTFARLALTLVAEALM